MPSIKLSIVFAPSRTHAMFDATAYALWSRRPLRPIFYGSTLSGSVLAHCPTIQGAVVPRIQVPWQAKSSSHVTTVRCKAWS